MDKKLGLGIGLLLIIVASALGGWYIFTKITSSETFIGEDKIAIDLHGMTWSTTDTSAWGEGFDNSNDRIYLKDYGDHYQVIASSEKFSPLKRGEMTFQIQQGWHYSGMYADRVNKIVINFLDANGNMVFHFFIASSSQETSYAYIKTSSGVEQLIGDFKLRFGVGYFEYTIEFNCDTTIIKGNSDTNSATILADSLEPISQIQIDTVKENAFVYQNDWIQFLSFEGVKA